mgnify:CR=1 FL=1
MLTKRLKQDGSAAKYADYVAMGKFVGLLAACTFTLLVVIGFAAWVHTQTAPRDGSAGGKAVISESWMFDMLEMEIAGFERNESSRSGKAGAHRLLFELVTGARLTDPLTVLASEIGGIGAEASLLRRERASGDDADSSLSGSGTAPLETAGGRTGSADQSANRTTDQAADNERYAGSDQAPGARNDEAANEAGDGAGAVNSAIDERRRIKAFIYHSHNRESWVPELEGVNDPDEAYDPKINITLLGKRLAERLEENGIGAKVSDKDYPSAVKDFNYNLSYNYSLKTVEEAAATYPDLQYYFDIHRDSQPRELTTATIDGVAYAQVYFIIGYNNPNWKENEAFAQKIHDRLEARYPGLSRGIYGKTSKTGNGRYNQHISPNAILIEVGGPENTLEESYRTIDVLAEVIADLFWDAEKVDLPVPAGEIVSAWLDAPAARE